MSEHGPTLFVGTYADGGAQGVWSLTRDPDGTWSPAAIFEDGQNVSFAVRSGRHGLWYFVNEAEPGALGVYRRTGTGWERCGRVPSGGDTPCYLALDAEERRLAIANYGDGSMAVFVLDDAGLPSRPPAMRRIEGQGPVADRQEGPHAHCVCFGHVGDLYHVDLGADRIYRHGLASCSVLGPAEVAYKAPPGSGPRHLVMHPTRLLALLASELASTLTVLDIANEQLVARRTVSTLPTDFTRESLVGHLSLNAAGTRVYVTNRGHDSIAVFGWRDDGALDLLRHVSSRGASPRAFALLKAESQLILANETGGTVAVFAMAADGTLRPRQHFALPGAAFPFVA